MGTCPHDSIEKGETTMECLNIKFRETEHNAADFFSYLRLRKRVFVDHLRWPIWHDGDLEQDQYDNPHAFFTLVKKGGRVVAGARLLPDTATWFGWSHMLKDVAAGKIDTIPEVAPGSVTDFDGIWECSRLVVDEDALDAAERREALGLIVNGLATMAQAGGASAMVSLSPPTLRRLLKSYGYHVTAPGGVFVDEFDGRRYCALQLHLTDQAAMAA